MPADSLQPNYLTVGADGTVGARFTGEVYADGIVLPADASGKAPPPLASRIEWTTDGTSDGGLVAVVAGTNFAGNNEVAVESYASTEGDQTATLLLQAFDDTGTLQTGIQILHDPPANPAQRVLAFAGSNNPLATIIDSNGNSSFVRTPPTFGKILQFGYSSFSAPANTWAGVNVYFPAPFTGGAVYAVHGMYVVTGQNYAVYSEIVNLQGWGAQINYWNNGAVTGYMYLIGIGDSI